jgi:uncharacterized protein (DUF736 family)
VEQQTKDIGALWQKVSKNGKTYLSGTVNGQRVVVFKNERKQEGERTPDWRIYPEAPREDGGSPVTQTRQASTMQAEDIPFVWMLPYLMAGAVSAPHLL